MSDELDLAKAGELKALAELRRRIVVLYDPVPVTGRIVPSDEPLSVTLAPATTDNPFHDTSIGLIDSVSKNLMQASWPEVYRAAIFRLQLTRAYDRYERGELTWKEELAATGRVFEVGRRTPKTISPLTEYIRAKLIKDPYLRPISIWEALKNESKTPGWRKRHKWTTRFTDEELEYTDSTGKSARISRASFANRVRQERRKLKNPDVTPKRVRNPNPEKRVTLDNWLQPPSRRR